MKRHKTHLNDLLLNRYPQFKNPVSLKLSIVLASYNRESELFSILNQLSRQHTRHEFEVIGVLQGYSERVIDAIRNYYMTQLNFVCLCYEKGIGLIAARNVGIEQARGEIIAFLDDDIQIADDWIEQIVSNFTDESVGGVGGCVEHGPGFSKINILLQRLLGNDPPIYDIDAFGFASHPISNRISRPQDTKWLPGTAAAYRRSVFEQVGLLEERFWYGFEDVDFGARVRRHGWRLLLVPSATIVHYPSPQNRMARLKSVHHMETVRVLSVFRILQGKRFWKLYYWLGFSKVLLLYIFAAIRNREPKIPLVALNSARQSMRAFE